MFPKLIFLLGFSLTCSASDHQTGQLLHPISSGNFHYPCELCDYDCIKNILAGNSDCDTMIWNSVPSKMSFNNVRIQIPFNNQTAYLQYYNIYNIDKCKVAAFFFNLSSNVAVLGLECPNLILEGYQTIIQHYPNAENQYYSVDFEILMPTTYLTTNLHHANNMDLCETKAYPYLTAYPRSKYTPGDMESAAFLSTEGGGDFDLYFLYIREFFLSSATTIFYQYVNYMLCDFNCGNYDAIPNMGANKQTSSLFDQQLD